MRERNTRRTPGIAAKTAGGIGIVTGGILAHPVFFIRRLKLTTNTRRRIPRAKTSPFAILRKSLEYEGKIPIPTSCEDKGQNTAEAGLYTSASSRRCAPNPVPAQNAMMRKSRR
jgi:hypothetical protein